MDLILRVHVREALKGDGPWWRLRSSWFCCVIPGLSVCSWDLACLMRGTGWRELLEASARKGAAGIAPACRREAEPVNDKQMRWSSAEMEAADVSTVCFHT